MALPSTGPISPAAAASELGITVTGINLNDSRVRTLAGKPSGPITLADLRGKSGISNMVASVNPSQVYIFETVYSSYHHDITFTANVSGGVAPYSYSWSSNVGNQQGGANGVNFTLRFPYHQFGSFYSGEVQLAVTDQQGTVRTVNVPVQIEFYGQGVIWA